MIKITPLFTEKSIKEAISGKYTFLVDVRLTKEKLKVLIGKIFKVEVSSVRTLTKKGRNKKNYRGQIKKISATKKAIITLKGEDKIDVFDEEKKKK